MTVSWWGTSMLKGLRERRPSPCIGILAHNGTSNLGDEAIVAAVIHNVRLRYPLSTIVGFSVNPEDTRQRHGIKAFPVRPVRNSRKQSEGKVGDRADTSVIQRAKGLAKRAKNRLKSIPIAYRFLRGISYELSVLARCIEEMLFCGKSARNLRGVSLLIVAGSGQLSDHCGGPWGFPYTLFRWSLLAKLIGTRVAFLSIGAGPISSRMSRRFIKYSLLLASYRSYRDESSKTLVENIGVVKNNHVFPDLAFGLPFTPAATEASPKKIVGINPVPFFDSRYWHESNVDIYQEYVSRLAEFSLWLRGKGYKVRYFPTQLRADPPVIDDIRSLMNENGTSHGSPALLEANSINTMTTVEDVIREISTADLVIANRYHGIVLSFLLHKPVLGIAYQQKTVDLMNEMGQSRYTIDARALNMRNLMEAFESLEAEKELIAMDVNRTLTLHRCELENQYDRVFELLC